ncbi:hypothetical protein DICPUDRAFT_37084 [Dictyostelium purpureum]|uniref:dolichyl-P-Man:Man5GlcNAc2-PP-dolichol alpha-1,3-mannosyltransferase n=1 Tax=Dictyostelium purpureum TaxID=5786 RepID=F0ZS61_DICPU|nr:uncharacterized protein DICPUDRAFT_37084 [Dictyostelium purpureum]EGC33212.1 hypothetical protein DICPUDRAFT_37084 [Dictyostelium purpureum]|eukprot:XP_003290252.1 hypothetical protein DICPUDRAFT_37084 [Dictyostelium purpureum]
MIENAVSYYRNNQSKCFTVLAIFLIVYEIFVNKVMLDYVKYTEIDWSTYMQQVKLFLNGELDYINIEGDTGPCVYPAGYIYVFSLLFNITDQGRDIMKARYIFAGIYLVFTIVVFLIYSEAVKESEQQLKPTLNLAQNKSATPTIPTIPTTPTSKNKKNNNNSSNKYLYIPFYIIVFLCLSKRIHSIFSLRLFNDCISMLIFYVAVYCFIKSRWSLGCMLFSMAVSIKMNLLLFAPSLLLLLLMTFGFWRTIPKLMICGLIQVAVALPFLKENYVSYLIRAFEFSRQFLYKWTVNWRFVPEDIFLSKEWALSLLFLHLTFLVLFYFKWVKQDGGLSNVIKRGNKNQNSSILSTNFILLVLFTGNFIGITFSRSLHYQFYVWYFHTIPFLLWSAPNINIFFKILFIVITEYSWNVYPSTSISSGLLVLSNVYLIISLYFSPVPNSLKQSNSTKTKKTN